MKNAVDLICSRKSESNVENSVGVISMKYSGPEISLHLTEERRWNSTMAKIDLSHGRGSIQIHEAIRKARLALKHKRNPKQEKKIIVIVCSPIATEARTLTRMAKDLKKNGLSMDIICFGVPEEEETKTVTKLRDMIEACKSGDNCNFVHLPSDKDVTLEDMIKSSPIIHGGFNNIPQQAAAAAPAGDAAPAAAVDDLGIGIDPNVDPELYHAIRLSLEEQRQEMEAAAQNPEGENADGDVAMENAAPEAQAAPAQSEAQPAPSNPAPAAVEEQAQDDEEVDEDLLRAIAMSMEEDEEIEEDELKAAMMLSMQEEEQPAEPAAPAEAQDDADDDREFLANLMAELPGVDADQIDVDAIMQSITDEPEEDNGGTGDKADK